MLVLQCLISYSHVVRWSLQGGGGCKEGKRLEGGMEGGKGEKYTLNNSYLGKLGTPCHASSWEGLIQQGWVLLH